METETTRRAGRVFRRLLDLFPFEFRRDYGREMTLMFDDQCRDAAEEDDKMSWIRLWWETFSGILSTAPREHAAVARQDLGYALRTLAKNPGFTAVAVLTLALGIGANSTIFSLIDGVLLRPLAYPEPDRLMWLWTVNPAEDGRTVASLHDFEDWRDQSESFESLAVFSPRSGNLSGETVAQRVSYSLVSSDFFRTVGVEPALGRAFREGEDQPGRDRIAILSHAFWRHELGGDPAVLGKKLELEGWKLEVVGIMPEGFDFLPGSTDLWKPLGMKFEMDGSRSGRWIPAIGRLKKDVSLAAAQAEMEAVAARLAETYPKTNAGWTVRLQPLRERIVGNVRPAVLMLWAAVGVVLLIVCVNLANLLLARGTARRQEIALRSVLGAGRGRIVRQLLAESLLLSLAGALAGLFLAFQGVRTLPVLAGSQVPRLDNVGIDARVLGFTLALAVATGVLFGLLPALRLSRSDLSSALKEADRSGAHAGGRSVRAALVVAEVALAAVVLVASGLLVRSFTTLGRVEPGFDPAGVLSVRVAPPWAFANDDDPTPVSIADERVKIAAFFHNLQEHIESLPGIASASAINRRPLAGHNAWVGAFVVEGRPEGSQEVDASVRTVMPRYFETLGIPLLRGRLLEGSDDERASRVVVVDQTMADTYWPDADPVGQRLRLNGDQEGWSTVVGVVGTVRDSRMENEPYPMVYWPLPQARWGHFMDWGMDLVVRAESDPLALAEPVRRAVLAADKDLPAFQVTTLDQAIRDDLTQRRFYMTLLSGFALLALVLTAVGIYGVMAYSVGLRTHEMGVRMALGAPRSGILTLVLRQGMKLVVFGAVAGLLAAFGVTRLFASLLYGVGATDGKSFVLAAAVLLGASVLACLVPARRATRVDPIRALHCD